MTKEEYLRKVAEMQTDISAIKQEGRNDTKTCKGCIHQAVCYRYSYGLPENYADKCGDYEPSRHKGHWIETEYHRWRCSVCREKGMSEWDNIHDVRTNFCPNCGAKMESGDKE